MQYSIGERRWFLFEGESEIAAVHDDLQLTDRGQ